MFPKEIVSVQVRRLNILPLKLKAYLQQNYWPFQHYSRRRVDTSRKWVLLRRRGLPKFSQTQFYRTDDHGSRSRHRRVPCLHLRIVKANARPRSVNFV